MNLRELDEWQGLTADMVREWLANLDPAIMPSACIADDIIAVSELCGETPQTLLREINPRWRKGFPSNAALAEHDEWLIRAPWGAEFVAHISYGGSDDGYMIMIPPDSESGDCGGIEESVWGDCFYWPCDGNANRVRWPVDAKGSML